MASTDNSAKQDKRPMRARKVFNPTRSQTIHSEIKLVAFNDQIGRDKISR